MKPRILVAESDAELQFVLSNTLSLMGWDVTLVETADAAMKLWKSESFDFLTLEMDLPGLNGLNVARFLFRENRKAQMVMIGDDETFASDFLTLGGKAFFSKENLSRYFEAMNQIQYSFKAAA